MLQAYYLYERRIREHTNPEQKKTPVTIPVFINRNMLLVLMLASFEKMERNSKIPVLSNNNMYKQYATMIRKQAPVFCNRKHKKNANEIIATVSKNN